MSRLTQPATMDDLLLFRLSRLLATGGAPVIRLCEGRYGITRREWRLLAMLAQQDGLLSSELAQRMQLDRSRTSRAITSLVAKKLLLRTPRPGDRRQATLVLTSAGRTLVEELFPQVQAINERLLSVLAPSDAQQLDLLLDALQRSADRADGQGGLPKANRRLGRRPARVA